VDALRDPASQGRVAVAPTLLAMTGLSRLGVLLIIKDIVGLT
jgi:hypothetical protein